MIAPIEHVAGRKARIKVEPRKIATRDEAERVLHDIAIAVNAKRKVTADMDAEILLVKNRCQEHLTTLEEQIELDTNRLADFAELNPEIFPKDRKSVQWIAGKFGFRTDTPSLAPISRAFTWAKILAVIGSRRLRKFIRTKIEVDKDAILARCGTKEKPTKFQQHILPALGLKLVQEEKFFVEPDLTKLEVKS